MDGSRRYWLASRIGDGGAAPGLQLRIPQSCTVRYSEAKVVQRSCFGRQFTYWHRCFRHYRSSGGAVGGKKIVEKNDEGLGEFRDSARSVHSSLDLGGRKMGGR